MSTILNCSRCNKDMRLLEPHTIVDERYLCVPCGKILQEEKDNTIKKFYENLGDGMIPFIGFWKRPEYHIISKYTAYLGATSLYGFENNTFMWLTPTMKLESVTEYIVDIFMFPIQTVVKYILYIAVHDNYMYFYKHNYKYNENNSKKLVLIENLNIERSPSTKDWLENTIRNFCNNV